jgi:hypothetical protein
MQAAERDGELVAHPATQRASLGEAQVMRVAGPPPTNEAGLRGDKSEVRLVPVPTRLSDRQRAFVDAGRLGSMSGITRGLAATGSGDSRSSDLLGRLWRR